jgi:CMP-N,N'-diacetyllegionaminic acid synthase
MTIEEKPTAVALVPARAGSKRVADKNIKPLAGHPMIAYTITAARESGVFDDVIVSTDSELYADIARHYGASVPFMRPAEFAGERSPDIEWVEFTLARLRDEGREFDCFSILRPTSPFRQAATIRRAWEQFTRDGGADSLRAVEKCKQHPAKMWIVNGARMTPLMPEKRDGQPLHSMQYPSLPEIYVQNASLEIAWTRVVFDGRTISGEVVMPFFTESLEGFDINNPRDWFYAEHLLAHEGAQLPRVDRPPFNEPVILSAAKNL